MPLASVFDLFASARSGGYAIGYFESWNLESLLGVVDAAEETRSPIILGFNGEFLTHKQRVTSESIRIYAELGRAVAEAAAVPCGLIFNECADDKALRQAVTSGFNLVMLADPVADYTDTIRRVHALVQFAHLRSVAVEAELGELPSGLPDETHAHPGSLTDPAQAAAFVNATGIDLLSVSVGNMHIRLQGEMALDLDRLAQIQRQTGVYMGLHGGSGIPANDLRAAGKLGVVKVNFGTYLKQRYLAAIRQALGNPELNPHQLLGMGSHNDLLVCGRLAVRDAVLERIESLGCCGRA